MAAVVGIGIGLIGSGVSAQGSKKSGKQARRLANFNFQVSEKQAEDALTRGREAEDQLRSGVRKLIGSQRAGFAGQNVSLNDRDGAAITLEEDTIAMQERDLDRIRVNAAREAWGFRMQGRNYAMGGQSQQQQRNAEATGTILGGLGNAFTEYARVSSYTKSKPKPGS
jgi:hypothetical protein